MKRRLLVSAILSVLLLAALAADVHAAEVKINASDGAAHNFFGASVAISGDYAVVGAPGDGSASGSAYIFKRDGTAWTEQAKITASDGATGDYFGESVAISGDYAVVGVQYDADAGYESGSAYIFKRDGTAWTEQAKITASDGAGGDRFGVSVAISGDYAVVGAWGANGVVLDSGSAYIFKHNGTAWTEQAKITASDGAAEDYFGESVAISGNYVVVGAWGGGGGVVSEPGSAYIFKRDGTAWTERAKITASDGTKYDGFGGHVAISGDYAVVGACGANGVVLDSGSAYIFKHNVTVWTEQAKITASDGATDDRLGRSVALSGDYAVVGACEANGIVLDSGPAYIFKRNGTAWTEQAKITASDGATDDWFGLSVAISGDYAVVGACGANGVVLDSGSAYIYDIPIEIIDPSAAVAPAEYDIVASVPELATVVILTLVGLLAFAGYVRYSRRKN